MKSNQMELQAALIEAVEAVNDVITISKKARRIGAFKQFLSRFRNSRIATKLGSRKKSKKSIITIKPERSKGYQTRRPYGINTC